MTGCGYQERKESVQRVGVLGGTFDPIHLAHLIVAEEARVRLGLSRVFFVPAGIPYLKAARDVAPAKHRLEMVRQAVASNPCFEASAIDVGRPGPTYTVDTLAEVRRNIGPDPDIYLLLGWDVLSSLPIWREPGKLLDMCIPVGVPRPGWPRPDMEEVERAIPGSSRRIVLLDQPVIGISATDIRARVAAGISVRYLVPEAVEKYIAEHGLYKRTT